MNYRTYISFLGKIEKLKCSTRHSWTSTGRHESVAEHSWRLSVMALLCADEFPELDMNRVIRMCLIHDFGEAVTGDIPSFLKTEENEVEEEKAVASLLGELPTAVSSELTALFDEMQQMESPEAKLFKALDNMEAIVSHNEAPISTWLPLEYTENLVYGERNCAWHDWLRGLREVLKQNSTEKIEREGRHDIKG